MVRIRHRAAHIRAVRLVVNLVVVRCISCDHRGIALHRRSEGVRRIVALIHPAVEVIAGLIVRRCLRRNLSVVRDMIVAVNHLVCMGSVGSRGILDFYLVLVDSPLCLQLFISGQRRRKVVRRRRDIAARILLKPAHKVVAGLVSRGGCARTCGSRFCRRTAALNSRLCARRHAATVRIKLHLILRELIVIRESRCRIAARHCGESCAGTVLQLCCHMNGGTGLRRRIAHCVHLIVIGITGRASLGLCHLVLIDTRELEADIAGPDTRATACKIRSRNCIGLTLCTRRRSCRHRISRSGCGRLRLQRKAEGLGHERRCLTGCNGAAVSGQRLLNREIRNGRGHRRPLRVEIDNRIVLRGQIHHALCIGIICAASVRLGIPAVKDITGTTERITVQILGHIIHMVGIRHRTCRIARICIVTNFVGIRQICRVDGLILGDRLREIVRIIRIVEPTIEMIACLIRRTCRLCRCRTVGDIVFPEDFLIRVCSVRIRCVRHHNDEFPKLPLRLERIILLDRSGCKCKRHFRHGAGYRIRNFVDPAPKVIPCLVSCRAALTCRRGGLTRIVSVFYGLRCRGDIAALRIKSHLIHRKVISIVEDHLTADCARREILNAPLSGKCTADTCRDGVGHLVLCRIIGIIRYTVIQLLHHITVGARHREGKKAGCNFLACDGRREITAAHAEEHRVNRSRHIRRIGRTRCTCRHRCIRADAGHDELEVRRQQRRHFRIRQCSPVTGDILLNLKCLSHRRELLPLRIELQRCRSRPCLDGITRCIALTAAIGRGIPSRKEIARTHKARVRSRSADRLCDALIGVRIRARVIRGGIELISVRRNRTRSVIRVIFDVGVDSNGRRGLHLAAVPVVCLRRDCDRTGLLRCCTAGRGSGILECNNIRRLAARNAEGYARCHRIRDDCRNRCRTAANRNFEIGNRNLRRRIEACIHILSAVKISEGINNHRSRHAIRLAVKRRVNRRSAVLILQHQLLFRRKTSRIRFHNPVAVVRHQNRIGTVCSAVDQEISVRCRVQLYLRIGRRIIHAEANIL